jgi:hypothetical protein
MTETRGTITVDGKIIGWDKHSTTGLAIEFSHKNLLRRIHIGGELNESRIKDIINAYEQGHDEGFSIGKEHLKAEFKRLMGNL